MPIITCASVQQASDIDVIVTSVRRMIPHTKHGLRTPVSCRVTGKYTESGKSTPVILVVVQTPAHWRSACRFLGLRLCGNERKSETRSTTQEYLEQAKHSRAQWNGRAGDDAFAHATHVIASAAKIVRGQSKHEHEFTSSCLEKRTCELRRQRECLPSFRTMPTLARFL